MPLHAIAEDDMEVDVYSDAGMYSESNATVKAYFDGPAGGSVSSSDRSSSPTPTLQSMTGSMYDGLFDEKHGRKINSTCLTYGMAADELEVMVRIPDLEFSINYPPLTRTASSALYSSVRS